MNKIFAGLLTMVGVCCLIPLVDIVNGMVQYPNEGAFIWIVRIFLIFACMALFSLFSGLGYIVYRVGEHDKGN